MACLLGLLQGDSPSVLTRLGALAVAGCTASQVGFLMATIGTGRGQEPADHRTLSRGRALPVCHLAELGPRRARLPHGKGATFPHYLMGWGPSLRAPSHHLLCSDVNASDEPCEQLWPSCSSGGRPVPIAPLRPGLLAGGGPEVPFSGFSSAVGTFGTSNLMLSLLILAVHGFIFLRHLSRQNRCNVYGARHDGRTGVSCDLTATGS